MGGIANFEKVIPAQNTEFGIFVYMKMSPISQNISGAKAHFCRNSCNFRKTPVSDNFAKFPEISWPKKKGGKIFENFRKFLEISGKNFRENFAEIFVRSCRCQKIFDKLSKNFLNFLKNFTKKFCEFLKIFSKKTQNNVFR